MFYCKIGMFTKLEQPLFCNFLYFILKFQIFKVWNLPLFYFQATVRLFSDKMLCSMGKKEFRWKYSNNYTFNTFNLSSTYLKLIDVSAKFPVKWRIFSTLSLYFEIIFTFAGGF